MMLLGFLDSIDVIAKDEGRRLAAPPVERVLSPGSAPIPDQNARIAALIRDLEVVNETQMTQPGGISLARSPVIQALVNEGDAAVEPLLKCLANDQRLTRSVAFGRDFQPNRTFITVEWAAFETLQAILKTRAFGPLTERGSLRSLPRPDNETRQAFVKEIRDFWNRTKTLSDAERWYSTLADSQGTERQWLEAARNITRTAPEKRTATLDEDSKSSSRLLGEALRDGREASVSQLLARRGGTDQAGPRQYASDPSFDRRLRTHILPGLLGFGRRIAGNPASRGAMPAHSATGVRTPDTPTNWTPE